MKKLLTLVIAVLAFSTAWSQTEIKINPIGILFGNPDISAEFGINESVGVEPFIQLSTGTRTVLNTDYKTSGFHIGGLGKYYFHPDKGIDKFWMGCYIRTGSSQWQTPASNPTTKVENQRFALGFGIGYKWTSSRNIIFEIGGAIGRAFYDKTTATLGTANSGDFNLGLDFLGRLQVGYRFGGGSTVSSKKKR